jgi:hypothetical protein
VFTFCIVIKSEFEAKGKPPGVTPSCITRVFLVVSMVTSAEAPVKAAVCDVLPRLSCN